MAAENEVKSLLSAESRLTRILKRTPRITAWGEIYIILESVYLNKLYEDKHKSFTAWLKHAADRSDRAVSHLWEILEAGRIYTEYRNRALKRHKRPKKVDDIKVSAKGLLKIAQIAKDDTTRKDQLIEQLVSGDIDHKYIDAIAKDENALNTSASEYNMAVMLLRKAAARGHEKSALLLAIVDAKPPKKKGSK